MLPQSNPPQPLTASQPLISVIIPCYNHGQYLPEAVASIWRQQYAATEIIVVDDGSSDNTRQISEQLEGVTYLYQHNQGLSAARNTGIRASKGEYLVFLDADDWLFEGAFATNLAYLQQHPEAAFVSGGHEKIDEHKNLLEEVQVVVEKDHYLHLLEGNYIGMHATLMYRRWVFNELLFDTSLKACEDYDLYLKIARNHPVLHHTHKIAAYRIHTSNMSGNIPKMLHYVLRVQGRQKPGLKTEQERRAFKRGIAVWKDYYGQLLYQQLKNKKITRSADVLKTLLLNKPTYFFRYMASGNTLKSAIKKSLPGFSLRWMHRVGVLKHYTPAQGKIEMGDFDRTAPISRDFGYDRGGPVDRYYLENFLKQESPSIKGNVLEIGDNEYTLKFGGSRVSKSDILHVDEKNPRATYVGDLSNAPHLPNDTFDCIILTQTLHLIYDYKAALQTCFRMLKPGGSFLMTSPGITPIAHGAWKETWYWSFTQLALQRLMEETFPAARLTVETYGNAYAAAAFLWGLGLPEVKQAKLDIKDEHYQVIIAVKAVKPARN
jgi:glycosyltransferase involved in cell wall biosynthesis/SAM-dependent methyltransferase